MDPAAAQVDTGRRFLPVAAHQRLVFGVGAGRDPGLLGAAIDTALISPVAEEC
ncbi:hypothetical protein I552_10231 [Mycobacterium xenopi 3993]|nr:hypothetical protein I552_9758 [Mycobacterium xenopi 3993]EUA33011.1 hypothetical protein I552_10231 [Mycobacterium xenopi 3993]